ncbi:MAG: polyhydroxyalkanoic acid system family protein [Thermoguttaceae bacterium]
MPRITFEMPHSLGLEEATRRLKEKLAAALAEHQSRVSNLREEWRDHTLSFALKAMGMGVSGTVAVAPDQVKVDAELPIAAAFFKGAIEQRLRQEVGTLLT